MQSNAKLIRAGLLVTVILAGSIIATSCGSSGSTGGNVPPANQIPAQATNQAVPNGSNQSPSGFLDDSMAKAAAELGVSQEKLETAFVQARSELGISTNMPQPGQLGTLGAFGNGGTLTPRADRVTPPADGFTRPTETPRMGMSSELMAKVAMILSVSQADLEKAFAQAQSVP